MTQPDEGLRAALREAFDAGVEQGSDEATAYEWGSRPRQDRDEVFADLFEAWNPDGAAIRLVAAEIARMEARARACRPSDNGVG